MLISGDGLPPRYIQIKRCMNQMSVEKIYCQEMLLRFQNNS